MTAPVSRLTAPPSRPRRAAAWTLLLTVGACLLAAGCSSGGTSASGTSAGSVPAPAALPGRAAGAPAGNAAGSAGSGASAGLTAVPLPGGQSVIFTATLSLRATDIQATVARATQLAQAAGGYVSGEHASMTQVPARQGHDQHSVQGPGRRLPVHPQRPQRPGHQEVRDPAGTGRHRHGGRREQPGGLGAGRDRPVAQAALPGRDGRWPARRPGADQPGGGQASRRSSRSSARWPARPPMRPSR